VASDEREFIRWLSVQKRQQHDAVRTGIGDDMAVLCIGGQTILVSTDMLLDGVHFETAKHAPETIGYKAIACCLSDCAAMAVRPVAVCLSLAASPDYDEPMIKSLMQAAVDACEAFECELVGGDTTRWDQPLAIDVAVTAECYPDIAPVLRGNARLDDRLFVTGPLGGSRGGKHMTFVPRIAEAHLIAQTLGKRLHAMIDVSDGLAIDADRVAEASGVGVILDEAALEFVASSAARELAGANGRSVIERVLGDGEDFELLLAADVEDAEIDELHLTPVGVVAAGSGMSIRTPAGDVKPLTPTGYQHLR